MRTVAIALLCLIGAAWAFLLPATGSAQSRSEQVYTTAEQQPQFPGGKAALSRYLAQNIRFPSSLMRKNQSTGPVAAKFIVDKDGLIRDVRVTTKPLGKNTQKGMQEFMTTIIAAIEKMPRWQPGKVSGQPVAVFYTLPIEVTMQ